MERRRIAADLFDRRGRPAASGELSTSLPLSPASTQPVSPSNRTGHEPSGIQPFFAEDQLDAVFVAGDDLPSFGGLYSTGGGQSLDRPLAQIDAVRTPFEHAAADAGRRPFRS